MTLSILSSGVDSLYLSFGGRIAPGFLERMEQLRQEAANAGEPAPIAFEDGRQGQVEATGWGRYRYYLRLRDFDVLLSKGAKLPPAYVRILSAFLHIAGPAAAAEAAITFVKDCVLEYAEQPIVSRIDLYADFQGWVPAASDIDCFITRSAHNTAYSEPVTGHQLGLRFTGFTFGRSGLVGRLYDKTFEISKSGKGWMREVWGARFDPEQPVWRLEFQFRRETIAEFNLKLVPEVLASRQDLWRYGTRWLSLRVAGIDRHRERWPLRSEWADLSSVQLAPSITGVIRKRYVEHQESVLVRGFAGYLTSIAAIAGKREFGEAVLYAARRANSYLEGRPKDFRQIVAKKSLRVTR